MHTMLLLQYLGWSLWAVGRAAECVVLHQSLPASSEKNIFLEYSIRRQFSFLVSALWIIVLFNIYPLKNSPSFPPEQKK